jgi:hypothetical protein
MTKPWRPRLFGNEPYLMDPLHIALYYAHKDIQAKKVTAMEWIRSNPIIPNAEDAARKRLNLAPRMRP